MSKSKNPAPGGRLAILDEKHAFPAHQRREAPSCGTNSIHPVQPGEQGAMVAGADYAGNVALVTLGCAKNLVDSELMLGALVSRGFRPVGRPEDAELIVVNTCAFLQSAVQEGIERILEMAELKKSGRCRKLVVAGCMVERYRADLEKSFPEVDRFVSTDEILTIADDTSTTEDCFRDSRRPYFRYDEAMPRVLSTSGHSAYVKIGEGCNRPCAFCIIPKIRGKYRSRPMQAILQEVRSLLSQGVRELNLIAQDLTAYGTDFEGNRGIKPELTTLLREIEAMAPDFDPFWVRLNYAYPIGANEELIRQISESPVVTRYLDLPLQHISHSVLRAMQRPLGEKGTRELISQIRTLAPDVALRTTFVVGFPGETEADVDLLCEYVAEGHFTHVGAFPYSQESEAKSYTFENQVEESVKEERRARVMETQRIVVQKRLKSLVGTTVRVLVDGYHSETDLLISARAQWQGPETDGEVIINDVDEAFRDSEGDIVLERLQGKFALVEITDFADYDLVGRLVGLEEPTEIEVHDRTAINADSADSAGVSA